MNKIIGKKLFSTLGEPQDIPEGSDTLIERLCKLIEAELSSTGDRIVLVEADNPGFESPHGTKSRSLSEIIPAARRIATALVKKCKLEIGKKNVR